MALVRLSALLFLFSTGLAFACLWAHRLTPTQPLVEPPARVSMLLFARGKVKSDVITRLLAGDLTLRQAAAWFRHLDAAEPVCRDAFRCLFPGLSDEEWACRQVIRWACSRAPLRERDAVRQRLERELEGYRARGGVMLPEL